MFKKILIANRGEIACRIIKSARKLAIATVAVYSDADRDALHVDLADEAVPIGPPPPAQSYLLIDKIIEACRKTGAEAVHPGYGFLSEREAFAVALAEAGIVFIGPNPRAIAAMGDKIESKKTAARAKVSTVPGYLGEIRDAQHAIKVAADIGYPVMIKASAGGGGKGMRLAYNAREAEEGFALARSEAKSSFGDERVFVEKFIENPRHIEIQVLGDKHGQIIHLCERECSIQRRNQKVVEEAPSPLIDAKTRKAMGEQAVALAKAVDYDSAGTVEFVAGQDQSFYFLEMNTRLQVEHPVTELVTGIDIVEEMIRIAAGEKLALKQSDVRASGWAVETRIYAEDPLRNFLPSIGRLTRYRPPQQGEFADGTIRIDTGVFEGAEISMYYDPMIAKLVTHGKTRDKAIELQAAALDAFVVDGVEHNIAFLSALMRHPRWREGRLSTLFISEEFKGGFSALGARGEELKLLAAVAIAIDHVGNARRRKITQQMGGPSVHFAARRVAQIGAQRVTGKVTGGLDQPITVTFEGEGEGEGKGKGCEKLELQSDWWPGEPVWNGRVGGLQVAVQVRPLLNGYRLAFRGICVAAHVYTEGEAALAALMPHRAPPDTAKLLLCPMPGQLKALNVAVGQEIKAGEALCVVEAMKMENVLRAERDGVVKAVRVKPGDSLAVDAVIMEFG
jgi:propionyl-CoA carboxylase alpha chain